jgi:protein-S-isoprenylcysteine O-methyltransferase Ste14
MSPDTSAETGADVRFPPPLVFLIGVLVAVVFHYAVIPLPVPVDRMISTWSGVLIGAIAVGLVITARVLFSRTGQSPIPWKPSPELISRGPYRFTRNPMYVGLTLFQIGLGIALNDLWISLFALPALMVVHFIAVLPEERYLSEKFGASYRRYLTQVRRYL